MASSYASDPEVHGLPRSPTRSQRSFSVEQTSDQKSLRHDAWWFVTMQGYPEHLSILYNYYALDTVADD